MTSTTCSRRSAFRLARTSALGGPALAAILVAAALAALPRPGVAQAGSADALANAAGGDLPAGPDRVGTGVPANPAGLADADEWAFGLRPLRLDVSLGPVTGRDVARAGDGVLSRELRESWLRRIGSGRQVGGVDAGVGPLSIRRGPVALEVSTSVTGRTRLPADAVELLLFGNAGRTGEAGDFRLTDAAIDGAVWTRVGLAVGVRPASVQPRLAVGVRIHATIGHALVVTRDGGSVIQGDNATAALLLPSITTDGGAAPGFGGGLDLGVTWQGAGGVTGLTLHDAVGTFGWSDASLRYRAGETLVEGAGVETDFGIRPVSEAPASLRALARRLRPARRVELEHVRPLGERLWVRVSVRERIENGVAPGRPDARLLGVEWDARRWLDLAAHVGSVEGRARFGTGARLALGRWSLSAAWSHYRGGGEDGSMLALSVGR